MQILREIHFCKQKLSKKTLKFDFEEFVEFFRQYNYQNLSFETLKLISRKFCMLCKVWKLWEQVTKELI